MPHPRKHLKLTGDTHPPEVEDDLEVEAETAAERPEAATRTPPPARMPQAAVAVVRASRRRWSSGTERYFDAARAQVRNRPLTTLGGAFFAGFALVVLTRLR